MLERLAEQHVAIYAVIHDSAITKPQHRHLDLNDSQWELLSQLVAILKPFQIATAFVSLSVMISMSPVQSFGIVFNHLIPNEDDVLAIKNFKKTVARELKRRFTLSSIDIAKSVPVLCAAVDPRYCQRQLKFLSTEQRALVHDELENLMELEDLEDDNSTIDLEAPEPPTKKSKKDSAMNFLLGTLGVR